ncbi:MAG: Sau3AI family type II restriction endonuclease [Methylophilaceae bacterium]
MLQYDPTNKNSILQYAKRLEGQTLENACSAGLNVLRQDNLANDYKGKGNFGQYLEKLYFQYNPNSDSEPDFPEAELELKSSGLKQLKNKEYRAKERLVLNIIDFINEAKNNKFETSSFWKKNANLLLVFYLYEKDVDALDLLIKLVGFWNFPKEDLAVIKHDWSVIQSKIANGQAHEISEGDTLYLAACTKGGKGGNPRAQFQSKEPAKQRAYSLKPSYLNHVIANIAGKSRRNYGKAIQSPDLLEKQTLEGYIVTKFSLFLSKSVNEIVGTFDFKSNPTSKNFYANLTKKILNVELGKKIEEFEKAGIKIRTVRLNENNLPAEDVSFPCFDYETLVAEDWDNSQIKTIFDSKFLFIFLKKIDGELFLQKVKFWNMPNSDLDEVFKVWTKVREVVSNGDIVQEFKGKRRQTNFPGKGFNDVSHVRPHAKNAQDTSPLPVKDKLTKQLEYTKHCFWLNSSYISKDIYLK